jgi:hypothetical protein
LDDRLYVTCEDTLTDWTVAIDGKRDTIISRSKLWSYYSLCFDSHDDRVFMPSGYSTWIDGLDCRTNSLVDSVNLAGRARVVSYNAQGNHVFCNEHPSASVAIIDGTSMRVDTVIPVGTNPSALAWVAPHNRLYVANTGSSSISVIRDDKMLGVKEGHLSLPKLEVWPNPCRGIVCLQLTAYGSGPSASACIKAHDVAGRLVRVWKLPAAGNDGVVALHMSLDLRNLPDGVYYLSVGSEPGRHLKIVLRKT